MIFHNLKLKNIGPFRDTSLTFEKEQGGVYPVVIITGENGTGKSIILDAIRTALRGLYGIERDIIADKSDFLIDLEVEDGQSAKNHIIADKLANNGKPDGINIYRDYFTRELSNDRKVNWVIDYWSPDLNADTFDITNISSINIKQAIIDSLNKTTANVNLTRFISSIDYLKGSGKKEESHRGEVIFKKIKEIFDDCVSKNSFSHVERESITPMIKTHGKEVSLEKLSSGNILLVKHLIGLMSRMYGICRINEMSIEEMFKIEGVLLIDEVENHLHPKWQKSVIGIIRKHFPNLQIILTTHSPFVVSSVDDAKIYACIDKVDHSEIVDETADYSNYPVDDVLGTGVFDVDPFSKKISEKLAERMRAIKSGDKANKERIEKELISLNEGYFGYYNLKDQIAFYDKNETH